MTNTGELTVLSVRDLRARVNLIQEIMRDIMKEGTHFGKIPGCPKPSLWKPGAEIIASTFQIDVQSSVEDFSSADEKRYRLTCTAYSASGIRLGSAVGECSSNEEKYKWRKPKCAAEFEDTPADRRREKWDNDGQKQKQIRTESSDQANTILQMADKRAYVACVRKVTGASDIFTQDIEDMENIPTNGDASAPLKKPQPKKEAMNTADFRNMPSKFAGKCKRCNGEIKVGDDILYNSKIKGVYHPACLNPPEEAPVPQEAPQITPGVLKNLQKMAEAAKVKLIDRIGADGMETLEQITPAYAQELLEEFAQRIDEAAK